MWARAVAAGLPDELFWESTPAEVGLLLEEIGERRYRDELAAARNAGMIAAQIWNVNLKPGVALLTSANFVRERPVELTPEQMEDMFDAWAANQNAGSEEERSDGHNAD